MKVTVFQLSRTKEGFKGPGKQVLTVETDEEGLKRLRSQYAQDRFDIRTD